MQCLYCETELKPLRGLFDEDFCCKDHREKYFASFRKGITLLPVLDLPPLKRAQEAKSEETVPEETIPEVTAEVPEEPAAVELTPEPLLEAVAEPPEAELVEITELPELVAAELPVAASASVEAALDDAGEGLPATPRAADFLHLHVVPFTAADCYFMIDEDSFSACNGPAIPDVEVFCDAMFEPEERVAHLFEPADMMAAGVSGRAATPEPQPAVGVVAPSFSAWNYAAALMPELEPAELIADVEMMAAVPVSGAMAGLGEGQPLVLPPVVAAVPAFGVAMALEAHPAMAEAAQLDAACQDIESAPLMFSDMEPVVEIQRPAFQVSAAAMQLEEELKRAIEPPKTEAARLAEPEIARPAAMSAAPVSLTASAASFQPPIPAAPARPEAQLNVPAMSAKTDAVPSLAPEVTPEPPRGAAAEQPPSAHSSDPVQPAIQSSVRIKNWRLKITFAKPA